MEPHSIVCSDCKAQTNDRTKYMYLTTYCTCDSPPNDIVCIECGKQVLSKPCQFCNNHAADLNTHFNVLAANGVCSAVEVFENKSTGKQDFKAIADNRHTCLASQQPTYTPSDPDWVKPKDVRITPAIAAFLKTHHPNWKQIEPAVKKASRTYHEFGKAYQASYMTPTRASAGAKECQACKEEVFRAGAVPACRCRVTGRWWLRSLSFERDVSSQS